jgi:DNA-binding response OmpR family regulator
MSKSSHSHILIIEDNPGIATSLTSGLAREGYQVTWKDKGKDGIAFAQTHFSYITKSLSVRYPLVICKRYTYPEF